MKYSINEWIFWNNRRTKIGACRKKTLRKFLATVNVLEEFQRKEFDLDDISNWKATQYRKFFTLSECNVSFQYLERRRFLSFHALFLQLLIFFVVLNKLFYIFVKNFC